MKINNLGDIIEDKLLLQVLEEIYKNILRFILLFIIKPSYKHFFHTF